ncbi:S-layer homology domain-containing protein [Bacillus sp. AK128]
MKWLITSLVSLVAVFSLTTQVGEAHVVDQTESRSVQSYSDLYHQVAEYKGQSGVTFKSYSPAWNTQDQLIALEAELLRNKHGKELALLGSVEIYPDYPAGKGVLGQYLAEYEYGTSDVTLMEGRVIQLYGGNERNTTQKMATTLSHEYGHHFTFYHILDQEDKLPADWMSSEYAEARLLPNTKAHDEMTTGEYKWRIQEIAAEDYVQLFGSNDAIKHHTPHNVEIGNPFDTDEVLSYYSSRLETSQYKVTLPIPFYLTDYMNNNRDSSYYDLQFMAKELQGKQTYLTAQDGTGTYAGVQLGDVKGVNDFNKWYVADQLGDHQSWLLDSYSNDTVHFKLLQHEDMGFNRGSKTLKLTYANIDTFKTNQASLNLENRLSIAETKRLLQEASVKYGIPAEILKAIAFIETGMQQFDENGHPIITPDGGIGIMQVTLTEQEMLSRGINRNQLETDTAYNIEIGAQILKEKWNWANSGRIPKINDHNPAMLEHWYFAVMAYNGLSKRNDPNIDQAKPPYQERVYEAIRNYSFANVKDIPTFTIEYPTNDIMSFPVKQYNWPELNTKASQQLQVGDKVYTFNTQASYSNLRDGIDGQVKQRLKHYTPFEIIGGPYQPTANASNHYVMYRIKANGIEGYIASSNVVHDADLTLLSDISYDPELLSAVTYLNVNEIINGYQDGTYRPKDPLLRRHAAKILVDALNLELPAGYTPKQKDMKPGQLGYEEMVIAEAHGLMGQGSDYRPNEYLTRAQMASILVRAYSDVYETPATKKVFADIGTIYYNYDDINTLYFNGITIVDRFNPQTDVTRAHFALFLKRTLDLK